MASFFDIAGHRAAAAAAQNAAVPSTRAKDPNRPVPWVEKYRPKNLDDVSAQDHTISVLKRTLQSSNVCSSEILDMVPGKPPQSSLWQKSSMASPPPRPELMKSRVLELNASDERGISIVREKVKNFARITVSTANSTQSSNYPCPPYKIIILDEADSMTQDAQSALRRTMETYSKITRFCLICNYVTRIIDPLASRCSKFRFKPLDEENAKLRLEEIARTENVEYEDGVIDALNKVSEGDLRKAITYLQSAARLHNPIIQPKPKKVDDEGDEEMECEEDDDDEDDSKLALDSKKITVKSIQEIAGVIPGQTIDNLLEACKPKKGKSTYPEISRLVQDIVADGWSAGQLYNKLVFDDVVTAVQKNDIVLIFSEVDKRLVDGSDEHLQVLDLALRISEVLAKG
ncbi:unnamed protein product [Tuber aestivum]|uniref:Uncharacterized protein n=1 Tax=Tuber aestivum TaxID=59557 RepID=A0A292PX56_9PEZI|nr:unnamed protein product [Tuber aestivum]